MSLSIFIQIDKTMNFFKTLLASLLGTFIAMGLLLFIFILIIVAAVSGGSEKTVSVKDNSILHIQLNQDFSERGSESEFTFNPATFSSESSQGLNHFIKDLQAAKTDDKIKGIFLEVGSFSAAPSTLLDLRNALEDFKSSGKWIVSYSEGYFQGGYFVASAANEVYMYPEGDFDWRGLNSEIMFFKNMLDKLEIEAQVIRGPNNKFKSAVEPYIYDKMSPENKEQLETFISDIWKVILERISTSRNVPVETLNLYADSLSLYSSANLDSSKLIDGRKYKDEVLSILKGKVGLENSVEDKKLNLITLSDYHSDKGGKSDKKDKSTKKDKVAVVYAVGGIESGEGDDETIGSDRIAAALKAAREDEKVKAIVLRVNSPGGSALASDVIWRETQLIKQSGKPFYVSMGDYAASGGYYISCAADKIYANPNTITGSIGVFGVMPNFEKFWNNKLGITFDRFETNPHADLISANKALDETEKRMMQNMVTDIYNDFTGKVAAGRNMTQAQVDSIGQGRVWSGEDAKNLGLVDELGSLQDCIAAAAAKAGISDYDVKDLPSLIDPFEKLLGNLSGTTEDKAVMKILGDNYKMYQDIKSVASMKGVQARMPFIIEIK